MTQDIIRREDLHKIDFSDICDGGTLVPVHPGEIILEDFLKPLDMTPYRLAKELHVPVNRMTAIVNGERAVTVDTGMRLSKFFGTTVEFWLRLQNAYDMSVTKVDLSKITPCNETAIQ
ncbi:HigA family addiction module antitoxin [Terasakiella sp.]|uniref:HigA family addiction module antitoxin n=1 Tax=Terasakiella sp. TaxID=2034861 RepID=UPI003AA83928